MPIDERTEKRMMEEKQYNRITGLSDSEFLSFLYSERDRENNLRQFQGWNVWALAGAIVTVCCAGYYIIKDNRTSICFTQFLYCSSVFVALILCYMPVLSLLSKRRAYDYKKLRTIKEVSPNLYLMIGLLASAFFAVLIPIVDKAMPWNIVSICWMVLFLLFGCGRIVCGKNKDKIVHSYIEDRVFVSLVWEKGYFMLIGFSLVLAWIKSFRFLSFQEIGFSDFELSVCFAAFIVLIYMLLKVIRSENVASRIDVLIDGYVYKGDSKESIYRRLRINKMGSTVLESCANEVDELGRGIEVYKKKRQALEKIEKAFENSNVDIGELKRYVSEIEEVNSYLKNIIEQTSKLGDKLSQIEKMVPELKEDDDFKCLVSMLKDVNTCTESLIKLSKSGSGKVMQMVKKYHCEKYGGLCVSDCEHRHEKMDFWYKVVRWVKLKLCKSK